MFLKINASFISTILFFFKYLVAGLGDLRNDNDPNMTYEGENNVLLQQTSNWLLALRRGGYKQFQDGSPLESAQFLKDFDSVIGQKFQYASAGEALQPQSKYT